MRTPRLGAPVRCSAHPRLAGSRWLSHHRRNPVRDNGISLLAFPLTNGLPRF